MAKSQRNVFLIVASLVIIFLASNFGMHSRAAEKEKSAAENKKAESEKEKAVALDERSKEQLQQAVATIVDVTKERVAAAKTDAEAIQLARSSLEALRTIGTLGNIDTKQQSNDLFDALQNGGRPAVVEAIIRLRLTNALRQWTTLSKKERTKAIDGFVADVKKTGLTYGQASLAISIANMLSSGKDTKLATKVLKELAPLAHDSSDSKVKKMADLYDGIVRRLELPGKQLELEGKLLDGTTLDWSSFRGKVVLVDFHASWCGPCRAEVPNILENDKAFHDKGFEVIGINMDKDRAGAEKYVEQTGFKFPIVISEDPAASGWEVPMARRYGITAIPQVILVDRDGKVVSTNARGAKLGVLLKKLLGAPDQPAAEATSSTGQP